MLVGSVSIPNDSLGMSLGCTGGGGESQYANSKGEGSLDILPWWRAEFSKREGHVGGGALNCISEKVGHLHLYPM